MDVINDSLVADLFAAAHKRDGNVRSYSRNTIIASLLGEATQRGPVNRVGIGNRKTDAPSTYRQVGPTCPDRCPFLGNGCYAQYGHTAIQARASGGDVGASLRAAAVAMVAAVLHGRVARLHVSGDLGKAAPDPDYVDGLCLLADLVNVHAGRQVGTVVAWTYTHHDPTEHGAAIARLTRHGIAVRLSDIDGQNGAIVAPFTGRKASSGYLECPATKKEGVTCTTCRACWRRPDLTIVFPPHGSGATKAEQASPAT